MSGTNPTCSTSFRRRVADRGENPQGWSCPLTPYRRPPHSLQNKQINQHPGEGRVMTISRRHFVYTAAAIAFAAQSGIASAQDWKPTKDVEFVIPFAVGGGADIM